MTNLERRLAIILAIGLWVCVLLTCNNYRVMRTLRDQQAQTLKLQQDAIASRDEFRIKLMAAIRENSLKQ